MKKATIYDVAERAGVSKSLVSLVLRDDPAVSPARRERVKQAIEELDYRPSKLAQDLAGGRTQTIGVVVAEFDNLSYIKVLAGLREVLDKAGFRLVIDDLHQGKASDDPFLTLNAMHVEGMVIIAEPTKLAIEKLRIPAVMIGERRGRLKQADVISSDDAFGTQRLLKHLWDLGHRNIVHITGFGGMASNRESAYEQFFKEHDAEAFTVGQGRPTTAEGGYLAAKDLLASGRDFSAIYVVNDSMAAGAISALGEVGLRVPEDISVVGYDNSPVSAEYMLKLTTVDDRSYDVGVLAAKQLLERMQGRLVGKPKTTLLEPELIIRASSGPVKPKTAS